PGLPDERNEWGKSDYWVWGGVPISIYIIERFLRLYRQTLRKTKVLYAEALPGGVLTTYVSRPKRFNYKPGMYVFINCQKISRFEWHPYSITSAPGDAYIRLHVASLGDWSTAVHDLYSSQEVQNMIRESPLARTVSPTIMQLSEAVGDVSEPAMPHGASAGTLRGDATASFEVGDSTAPESTVGDSRIHDYAVVDSAVGGCTVGDSTLGYSTRDMGYSTMGDSTRGRIPNDLQILVDGPYGAPVQNQEQYRVLCLVGAGIGITPFASMLRHVMHQFNDHRCSHCGK
ncbi:unnamed protein product, partial [Ostreobium quekettii]